MKYWIFFLISILPISSFAIVQFEEKQTQNVFVSEISIRHNSVNGASDVLVQTEPRHSIEGLSCASDYWMILTPDDVGHEIMVTLLKNAQKLQLPVTVNVIDDTSPDFCRLNRVITHKKPAE